MGRPFLKMRGCQPHSRQEQPHDQRAMSPLRRRMIEDMTVRKFVEKTQKDYIRYVKDLTAFLGRSPDTATAEDAAISCT
jgi:hypothetical protein